MKKVALLISLSIIILGNVHAQDKKKAKEKNTPPVAVTQANQNPYSIPYNDQMFDRISREAAVCDSLISISKIPFSDGLRVVNFINNIQNFYAYYRQEYLKATADTTKNKPKK